MHSSIKAVLMAAALVLAGCESTPYGEDVSVTVHPNWPSPVEVPVVGDPRVMPDPNNQGNVIIIQDLSDWVRFQIFMHDVKRYMRDSREMICFYRKEIQGDYCYIPKI